MVYFLSFAFYPKVESRHTSNWVSVFLARAFQETLQPSPSKISEVCNDTIQEAINKEYPILLTVEDYRYINAIRKTTRGEQRA